MADYKIFYATNRSHEGKAKKPSRYGNQFSKNELEDLRFGHVTVKASVTKVKKFLNKDVGFGKGDGSGLAGYLNNQIKDGTNIDIDLYDETINPDFSESQQKKLKLGSQKMLWELQSKMQKGDCDVVVLIHGFNVNWENAVSGAIALQEMLNRKSSWKKEVVVVLFTWPSDGLALPYVSYKSDRAEAAGSGFAVGRGFLKLRDFLYEVNQKARDPNSDVTLCDQKIHLICHSMGNFVLQNAIARMQDYTPGHSNPLASIFEHTFLCSADVDNDALEPGKPLGRLHEMTQHISVYHNHHDLAMYISDYTKGNPKRLGNKGSAHPTLLPDIAHQIDCAPINTDLIEHGYFMMGDINDDIRRSIDALPQDDKNRRRKKSPRHSNVWEMSKKR